MDAGREIPRVPEKGFTMKELIKTVGTIVLAVVVGSGLSLGGSALIEKNRKLEELVHKNEPVVKDMKIVSSMVNGKTLWIRVVGRKVRQCGPPLAMIVRYGAEQQLKGRLTFMDDVNYLNEELSPDAQELGIVDFGWWQIDPHPRGQLLFIKSIHNCDGTLVPSVNGIWSEDQYTKEK